MIFVIFISWVNDSSERPLEKKRDMRTARHRSWATTYLYSRLNFGSLKRWFTLANYFFCEKILQQGIITAF